MTAVAEPKKAAKRKPPAVPGDKDFDWGRVYEGEPFMVYTTKDGVTVGLAGGKGRLKPGDFRKMSHMPEWQAVFYMVERVAAPEALVVSDDFDDDEYGAMVAAWQEWSGTTAGE